MRLPSRTLLATLGVLFGCSAGSGGPSASRSSALTPGESSKDSPSLPGRQEPRTGEAAESSPWLVADPVDLRAVTLIVQVAPPPEIKEAFDDLGARHRDLRPLMQAHSDGGFGSGFVMVARDPAGPSAYVVTNQHVVGLSTEVALGRQDEEARIPGQVLYVDPVYDLAIVKLSVEARRQLRIDGGLGLSPRPPRDQDVVIASGFPGIQGDPSYQVTRGHVSNERVLLDVDGEELAHIQHTAPIDRGSSGGPLLSERGELLGINTLKIRWREGVGLAVPASAIEAALEKVRARPPQGDPLPLARQACEQLLRHVSSGAAWRAERSIGAGLVAKEGTRSLWLLPDGETDWLAEFAQDPARVMALAIGFRLRHELGSLKSALCEPRSAPTDREQRFVVTAGGTVKTLVIGEEQGTLKLLAYTFSAGSGRSFLDPKKTSGKKWKPSL